MRDSLCASVSCCERCRICSSRNFFSGCARERTEFLFILCISLRVIVNNIYCRAERRNKRRQSRCAFAWAKNSMTAAQRSGWALRSWAHWTMWTKLLNSKLASFHVSPFLAVALAPCFRRATIIKCMYLKFWLISLLRRIPFAEFVSVHCLGCRFDDNNNGQPKTISSLSLWIDDDGDGDEDDGAID